MEFTLKIDYILYVTGNLRNQSIVRFERIVSGRFIPLTAPLPLTRPLAPAPLPLRSSNFWARSAPFFAPAPAPAPLTCSDR